MLQVGRDRAIDPPGCKACNGSVVTPKGHPSPIAASTPTRSPSDCGTLPHREALAESSPGLETGRAILCLEFSHVVLPILGRLYDAYSFQLLPRLGQLVARDRTPTSIWWSRSAAFLPKPNWRTDPPGRS